MGSLPSPTLMETLPSDGGWFMVWAMPSSTFRYCYELKLIGALTALGERLFGETATAGFSLVLNAQGALRAVHVASDGPAFRDVVPEPGGGFILFDAFDAPEYTAITWEGIERDVFERLLGIHFSDEDWKPLRGDGAPCAGLPSSHFVMV